MSLAPERFAEFFSSLYGNEPFPWQSRLADDLAAGTWPDCIDLPTASGKTSLIDILVYTLACQATMPPADRTVGRRIFFAVNRRVIVDEAHDRAGKIARALRDANDGILAEVAEALRSIGGASELPLDVAQLRGGMYRDSAWARSIVQPTIVCTTVDQLGSRLLFRGYGVSPGMQPIHAALCACDSVILLDEAHVTKAFAQTLRLVERYQEHPPGLKFIEMTATPSQRPARRFALLDDDRAHPVLKARQEAAKETHLEKVKNDKALIDELVKKALDAVDDHTKAIGVIVNRVQTAREVFAVLRERHPEATHLVIGRMRPVDRDALQDQLRSLVGPGRPDELETPVFVVATQCLEVGADYDFDALVTECASIDALRQRFGRLNRKGRPIQAKGWIITTDATLKDDDPVYGTALRETWEWLTEGDRKSVDFGIAAFAGLWDDIDEVRRLKMVNLTPDAAVLLPAHLDALCQTNPQPVPSPDVSFFIHGPQRDNAEVQVCWRADLGGNQNVWGDIVALLPPTSPECMTVPLRVIRRWMSGEDQLPDADVPVESEAPSRKTATTNRTVLRWRGTGDAVPVDDPNDLRPGDTIVVAAPDESSCILGHLPTHDDLIHYDVADRAVEAARRQRIIRVHEAVNPELVHEFRGYMRDQDTLSKAEIREKLGDLAEAFSSGPIELEYPDNSGMVFRFDTLLPAAVEWKEDGSIEDDGDDSSSGSIRPLLLSKHVEHVVAHTSQNVEGLGLASLASVFAAAAKHHDAGKADIRFTAMLAGVSPYEVFGGLPLGKSGVPWLSASERQQRRSRARVPDRFRHEAVSTQWLDHFFTNLDIDPSVDRDLVLHLVAAHHGYGRPFMPVCDDRPNDPELLAFEVDGQVVAPSVRQAWIPAHRLDSGVAERFWNLTRRFGWWGLAYLEAILRLADQAASAQEQREPVGTKEVNRV